LRHYRPIVGGQTTTGTNATTNATTGTNATTTTTKSNLELAIIEAVNGSINATLNEAKVIELIKKHANTNEVTKYVNRETKTEVKLALKHNQFDELLMLISTGSNVWITGGAGGGKTHSANDVAKVLGLDFYAKSMSAQTAEFAFFGFMNAGGNFVETDFYKAYTQGGIFCIDEIDNGSPNVLSALNSALANGSCSFANGLQKKHKDFIAVATANTIGRGGNKRYVGRLQGDGALIDRFVFVHWNYDTELEAKISGSPEAAKFVLKLRNKAEAANLNCIISPRATIAIAKLMAAGCKIEKAAEYAIFNKLTENEKTVLCK
jgi:cobaltochelatase CobS